MRPLEISFPCALINSSQEERERESVSSQTRRILFSFPYTTDLFFSLLFFSQTDHLGDKWIAGRLEGIISRCRRCGVGTAWAPVILLGNGAGLSSCRSPSLCRQSGDVVARKVTRAGHDQCVSLLSCCQARTLLFIYLVYFHC